MEQESFCLLGESAHVRIGTRSLEGQDSGVEVLVRLSPPGPVFDTGAVRTMLERLERLKQNGYMLTAQDGGWVVCEKAISEQDGAAEGCFALGLFADLLKGP